MNYLSQFLIAAKLIPVMKTSGEDCRIVLISSVAHESGDFNLDTIQATKTTFDEWKYYCNSKLFQVNHNILQSSFVFCRHHSRPPVNKVTNVAIEVKDF